MNQMTQMTQFDPKCIQRFGSRQTPYLYGGIESLTQMTQLFLL